MVAKQAEESQWQYNPDGKEAVEDLPDNSNEPAPAVDRPASHGKTISWQAPEFIAHPHPASWYSILFVSTIVLAAAVFLITKDYIAAGTIVVLGAIIALSATRKPKTATYELSDSSVSINQKKYAYSSFKSFSMLRDGNMTSINFFPLKRFMPLVSAYLDQADEDKIAKALGDHLPYEQRQMDSVDRLSRRLRL